MNGMRIAAYHGLLTSFIRMVGPISVHIARHQTDQKIQKLKLDDSQIADLLVFEAVIDIVALHQRPRPRHPQSRPRGAARRP